MPNLTFTKDGWEQYLYWQTQDKRTLDKINELIKACQRTPFSGIGKPEPLKGSLSDTWSRHIDKQHRLVYIIKDNETRVISCRFHYPKP